MSNILVIKKPPLIYKVLSVLQFYYTRLIKNLQYIL
nr:MAG TPA: hypothetical protein [Caudoviricetes sp.]